MAASVLLSADSTGLSFAVGGGSSGGTVNLSRNRLSELPPEVCLFVSLESLNLYQNCLRSLPDSLINLQALTYLNLSLPLKVLIACNNKLVSLPEELGQLRHLTELDVSCNEIQTLPAQVGQLETLRDLNIRRNHLVRLPPELADLPLVRLDFSCNKVTSIPVCYRQLAQLQTIVLDNNPLQSPPAQICIKGKIHIFKYLNLEANAELEQIDFIDSCVGEEEEEDGRSRGRGRGGGGDGTSLSSQFMAYIERRITREGSPVKTNSTRTEDTRRHNRSVVDGVTAPSSSQSQRGGGVERMRREAQLAALRYDEERQKNRSLQSYTKHKAAQSPTKSSPDSEGEDRAALSPTANQSPSYPSSGGVGSCRTASLRPESFLLRLGQKEEKRKGDAAAAPQSQEEPPSSPPLVGEDAELVEQLRKNIEARLKVSLPSDLGAALTDGVVLCHLANHVRPRSVPSIHVPSPAVPKLTMAKCRRNVENFLEACRRIGVPQSQLCLPLHILEERGLPQVAGTVSALLDLAPPRHPVTTTTTTTTTPGPSFNM
ncbi:Leucine-rich repeat and calponin homology domain-containing protein 3 [Larimichthys crocea]|nr:Leucine-rich repeat and calponin homology domain-containing protein 3 [Larimichthys crocea]